MKLLILIFLLINISAIANKADSLIKSLKYQKEDSIKIKSLIEIGDIIEKNLPDSAIGYYIEAYSLSEKNRKAKNEYIYKAYSAKALSYHAWLLRQKGKPEEAILKYNEAIEIICNDTNKFSKKVYAETLKGLGSANSSKGNFIKALDLFNKSLELNKQIDNKIGVANNYNNIGLVNIETGNFSEAIDAFQNSLKIYSELKDSSYIAMSYNNIGLVHLNINSFNHALDYFTKAKEIREKRRETKSLGFCYNNIASVEIKLNNPENALINFEKALNIFNQTGDLRSIASVGNNIASIYIKKENYDLAELYYLKSYFSFKKLNDKNNLSLVLGNLASVSTSQKSYQKSIKYSHEGLILANEVGSTVAQKNIYYELSRAYDSIGNYKEAYKYHLIYSSYKDSLVSIETNKYISDLEAKYQSEKKALEIENLNKEKVISDAEIKSNKEKIKMQNYILAFVIIFLLVTVIFSYSLYKQIKAKILANKTLKHQNVEIQQKNEEILSQRDEIEAQRNLVILQKHEIEGVHNELKSSIRYAERIQRAVLPSHNVLTKIFAENFILFKPRDVVSGDFYWATQIRDTTIIAVADCTGHGVPGAFMSMMGIAYLNEITRNENVTTASQVLNILRTEIINSLNKSDFEIETKDGMDMSLIAICQEVTSYELQDTKNESVNINTLTHKHINTFKCQWAGANNPLYVVTNYELQVNSLENSTSTSQHLNTLEPQLYELKGDKMPVGQYEKMDNFTNHELILQKGDLIYLFTDGFYDQFGGPKEKKYLAKNFKKLLLENSQKAMSEQKEVLENTLLEWIGNGEQIDDITILGIKL